MSGRVVSNWSYVAVADRLSPTGYMATGVYLTVLGVIAVVGNAIVIFVVVLKRMLCKSFNHLILNLALADLCVAISAYPLTAASGYAERWLFGEFGCIFSAYIIFMLSMVSMNTLLIIAVFRYTFICKPQYNFLTSNHYMKYVLGGVWFHAVLWTSLPLLGWSSYLLEPFGTSCTLNWKGRSLSHASYSIVSLITCYVLHASVITFCYVKIMLKARSLQFGITSSSRCLEMEKLMLFHKMRVERNVTIICLVMVIAYFIVWTPYALFSLLSVLGVDIPSSLNCLPTMFAKLSCALNPLIYTAGSSRFRGAFCSMCPGDGGRRRQRQPSPRHQEWLLTTIGEMYTGDGPGLSIEEQQVTSSPARHKTHMDSTVDYQGDMTKNGIYIGPANVNIDIQVSAF